MLWAKDIYPIFQGLLTITQTLHIHSLSCSTSGTFQYFTNEFHAWMGQPFGLATSPPTFQSRLHLCLVKLRCYCKYFSTMLGFNGGSIIKSLARLAWITSHCFIVWCLKLWIVTFKCEYVTSCTFCCQYVLPLTISPISFVGIFTSAGCLEATTYFSSFYNFPCNFFNFFLHGWVDIEPSYGNSMCELEYCET